MSTLVPRAMSICTTSLNPAAAAECKPSAPFLFGIKRGTPRNLAHYCFAVMSPLLQKPLFKKASAVLVCPEQAAMWSRVEPSLVRALMEPPNLSISCSTIDVNPRSAATWTGVLSSWRHKSTPDIVVHHDCLDQNFFFWKSHSLICWFEYHLYQLCTIRNNGL